MAGFRELLAIEWEAHAVNNFKANFPEVPVYHGDIAKLSVGECLDLAGIEPGALDVFEGSPPCQGFSTSGKRVFSDSRNQLFREYVRLLRGLRPKAFIMENVSGMVKGNMKFIFVEILRELRASGYVVSARLLNAMNHDVPQSRERLIFIGVRNDLDTAPSHPPGNNRIITVKQALEGCVPSEIIPLRGKNLEKMRLLAPGSTSKQRMIAGKMVFGKDSGYTFRRVKSDAPSFTIMKSLSVSPSFGTGLVMPTEDRYISISELKRLASFPDQFVLEGKFEERWARIGNSVPPLLAGSIAMHVKDNILSNHGQKQATKDDQTQRE